VSEQGLILVGKISGVFGLHGWLKIFSYTKPKANVIGYKSWLLKKNNEERTVKAVQGRPQGNGIVAQIDGVTDRDQALLLMGWDIYISHEQLPALNKGEYYWVDLVGLAVENLEGLQLGKVDTIFETGANDILIVKGERERAIPFLRDQTVKAIDLESGKMIVDWDADF
jgi:16S rRNA processing protein RimM